MAIQTPATPRSGRDVAPAHARQLDTPAPEIVSGPALEIVGGMLGYDGVAVAGPIDLVIKEPRVVALVGRSGCGKTTLLKSISGELPLLDGTIRLRGSRRERSWCVKHVARTLQHFPLLHWKTVEGNLRLAARIRRVDDLDVERVLRDFSALHLKEKYPQELSGGERCRASLAQAALTHPAVLLLDEPFTGLDLNVKEEVADRFFSLERSHGTLLLYVTHDLDDARRYSNHVVVLGGTPSARGHAISDPSAPDAEAQMRRAMLSAD